MPRAQIKQKLVVDLGKVAVAAWVGGPLAAAGVGLNATIDTARIFLEKPDESTRKLLTDLGATLGGWANAEGLDVSAVEQGLRATEEIVSRYGLTAHQIALVNLDADAAARRVLDCAKTELAVLSADEEATCRRAVKEVYASLLKDPALANTGLLLARSARSEIQLGKILNLIEEKNKHDSIAYHHPVDLALTALHEGRDRTLALDFVAASERYEAAVGHAVKARDEQLEVRARLHAARGLIELLASSRDQSEYERTSDRRRIDEHLDAATRLGGSAADLAVERALASALGDDSDQTAQLARRALELAKLEGNTKFQVNSLVVLLQAQVRLDEVGQAIALSDDVAEVLRACSDSGDKIVLSAQWLRVKCNARQASESDVAEFCQLVRSAVNPASKAKEELSIQRVGLSVSEVSNEFIHAGLLLEALTFGELAYEIAETSGPSTFLCNVALSVAELAASAGDSTRARDYLGLASASASKVRTLPPESHEADSWETLHTLVLQVSGSIHLHLAGHATDQFEIAARLRAGVAALEKAIQFATENQNRLEGNVDDFLTEMRWSLGRAKLDLNKPHEATALFRTVRTAPTMSVPRFVAEVGMKAWLFEAHSLLREGRCEEAGETVSELLSDGRAPEPTRLRAEQLASHIEHVVLPNMRWMQSPEATEIATYVRSQGLRQTVAAQVAPLTSWWREWQNDGEPGQQSAFLDFWGRGGFARVAAALRARPHAAIAVDATSVEEVRNWARMLCPLFDTVIVKWKGSLVSTMSMNVIRSDYGGPDAFGGHGYIVMGGLVVREKWAPTLTFANLLPNDAARLLATEALPLVSAGRLVLLPAPLVGCTQTTVGWTDHLLLELLGGVVNVISDVSQTPAANKPPDTPRVLDLVSHSLPYMADVDLGDLATVLDETDEWVRPLRALLLQSLSSNGLKVENWSAISALENDIQDACRQLRAGLNNISKIGGWHIANTTAAVSAASACDQAPGNDPITSMLQSMTGQQRGLAPWVPYWRLHERGGHLDWSHPIDNPSRQCPPSDPRFQSPAHAWLHPGTAGWRIPIIREP